MCWPDDDNGNSLICTDVQRSGLACLGLAALKPGQGKKNSTNAIQVALETHFYGKGKHRQTDRHGRTVSQKVKVIWQPRIYRRLTCWVEETEGLK